VALDDFAVDTYFVRSNQVFVEQEKLDQKLDDSMTSVHMRQVKMEEAIAKEIERATAVHEVEEFITSVDCRYTCLIVCALG